MRDIPLFTTEYGVASLVLKEIPYSSDAYVHIHDTCKLETFVDECCDFCVLAGANRVYATGKDLDVKFPLYTDVWQMECPHALLPKTDAVIVSMQKDTAQRWMELYNTHMRKVPTASFMSLSKVEGILEKKSGYFVYQNGILIGIGAVSGSKVDAIISLIPGAGKDVFCALSSVISDDVVSLEVASVNTKAINLYNKLGFICKNVLQRWYQIYP